MPAPVDSPCTARKNTSCPMLCERAQPAEAMVNSGNAPQHHRPAAKAVCQGAVKQVHEGEPEKVGRQRLLHLNGRGAQGRGNAGKGWQVGINRKRPQHAQNGEQNR